MLESDFVNLVSLVKVRELLSPQLWLCPSPLESEASLLIAEPMLLQQYDILFVIKFITLIITKLDLWFSADF